MNGFSLVLSAVMSALVALLMIAMPGVVRNTLPLGVSVPRSRVGEPVIRSSVRRFRLAVVVVLVVALLVAALLSKPAPALAASLPVLLLVAGSTLAYVVSRGRIIRAKRDGGWYDGVPVRLTASITREEPGHAAQPFGWYLAALVVLAVVVGIGVALYPRFPDPLPIHWNASGQVDGFAAKSVWSAFGPLMVAVGIVILLYLCSFLTRMPLRAAPSDSPGESARRAGAMRRTIESLLGQLALALAITIAWVTLASWLAPGTAWPIVAGLVLMVVLIVAAIGGFFLRYRRETAPLPGPDGSEAPGRADAPDDDRYWKAGVFYVNRRDPAIMVPKRFGIGWTINFGSPVGIAGGIVLLLAIAAGIILPLV